MNNKRNSNIEILRLISMLIIVISHYIVHSSADVRLLPLSFNKFLLSLNIGNIGTVLFMLISGYYLIDSKNIKLSKIVKLWLQVLFYSLGIYLIFILTNNQPFIFKDLIKYISPISSNIYWFMTVYIIIYLFHSYLNILLTKLSKKEYHKLIIMLLFIFSLLGLFTTNIYYCNELGQCLIFYIIGAYLKIYKHNIFNNNKLNYLILIICIIALILSTIFYNYLDVGYLKFNSNGLYNRNSIIVIMLSISIFNLFINKRVYINKFVNLLGTCTLGIYLLSEHPLMKDYLWLNIFNNKKYVYSNSLVLHLIISVLIVYIISLLIEFLRKITIDNIYDQKVSKLINNLELKLNKIIK